MRGENDGQVVPNFDDIDSLDVTIEREQIYHEQQN